MLSCSGRPFRPRLRCVNWTDRQYAGVKLYPNLGYAPTHPELKKVFALAMERDVPVIAHCSTGGIRYHGTPKEEAIAYGHPENYISILEDFPRLRISLTHFGGIDEWRNYLDGKAEDLNGRDNWVWTIYQMIASGTYPNLYTDVAYTMWAGTLSETIHPLNVLLRNPLVREHMLFASDFYMVELEKRTERQVSMSMRSILGEELYRQLAYTNPKAFLGSRVSIP